MLAATPVKEMPAGRCVATRQTRKKASDFIVLPAVISLYWL